MSDGSISGLWLALDRVRHAHGPGESVLNRLAQDPWVHDDPAVRLAWLTLTSPESLAELEQWGQGDLNPEARRITDAAIRKARIRLKLGSK
jgi:hypothetical protein